MTKIAIYCRVSTNSQTTDRQESELRRYSEECLHRTVSQDMVFVEKVSGFSVMDEREEYTRLKELVALGKIDTILFSEMTRLGRNSNELLREIEELSNAGVTLYFQKQDITVKPEKKDIGSKILLNVLAVTAEYEVSLFKERVLSGKISKVVNGGGDADSRALGYKNNQQKMLVIDEKEAQIVRRIFDYYANKNKSIIEICDLLNADHIPTKGVILAKMFSENREKKNLEKKDYSNLEDAQWRCSTISRMLHNELYIGHRHIEFKEASVEKNVNRNPVYVYDEKVESLRIIDDDTWLKVQAKLSVAAYNKNNSVKHINLLKPKLKCGECGSNFTVGKCDSHTTDKLYSDRTYRCYGRIKRVDKPATCQFGMECKQHRLDGLVIMLSLRRFAKKDYISKSQAKINELTELIKEQEDLRCAKKKELEDNESSYKTMASRLSKMKNIDDVVVSLLNEEQDKYTQTSREIQKSINKIDTKILNYRRQLSAIQTLQSNETLYAHMSEIKNDPALIKTMVDSFIQEIILYRISKSWNLVIIRYEDGGEMWGTVKSAKYKKEEKFYDEAFTAEVEYKTWIINNSENCFKYDKRDHTITYDGNSELYTDISKGTYTYDTLHSLLESTHNIGSFASYEYEKKAEQASS